MIVHLINDLMTTPSYRYYSLNGIDGMGVKSVSLSRSSNAIGAIALAASGDDVHDVLDSYGRFACKSASVAVSCRHRQS